MGGQSIGTFATKTEAGRELTRHIGDVERGRQDLHAKKGPHGALGPTVAEAVQEWLLDPDDILAANTLVNYRADFSLRIEPYEIASIRVTVLRTADVNVWRKAVQRSGASRRGVKSAEGVLRMSMDAQIDEGTIHTNPVVSRPARRRTKKSTAQQQAKVLAALPLPTRADVAAIVQAMPLLGDRLFTLVLAWSGPRLAEGAALDRATAVDENEPLLHVRRVIVREKRPMPGGGLTKGQWIAEPPKNGLEREVHLPTPLWEALRKYQVTVPAAASPRWDVLFPGRTEGPSRGGPGIWTSKLWGDEVWDAARASVNLQGLQTKFLRSYAGSVIYNAGASETEAQRFLGHETLQTTLKHYLRAEEDTKRDTERWAIRVNPSLTLQERLDALYRIWVSRYGDPLSGAI